jgi:hypothetical protein
MRRSPGALLRWDIANATETNATIRLFRHSKEIMNTYPALRKLRLVAGYALIGSVSAGVIFGWIDSSIDPRAIGASIGAMMAIAQVFHLV